MRRLPPLHALRVFEVAARAGSHAAAAAELGLTHGAVSRQVAVLEAWFGQRLFVRVGRSVVPTPAARAFAEAVSLTFDRLDAAAEICGRPLAPRTLRVSTPTTFAMRWLIPRLESFHAARPEAEVVVTTTTTLDNALRGGFDLAVRREPRLGTGAHHPWGAYRAVPFLAEANTLVVSPSLLAARPLRAPADLEGGTLLTSETRPGDWSDWLAAADLPASLGCLGERVVVRGRRGTLVDALARCGVDARANRGDGLALACGEDDPHQEDHESGSHQEVTDQVEVDPVELNFQRERQDRADDEQCNSGSNTHGEHAGTGDPQTGSFPDCSQETSRQRRMDATTNLVPCPESSRSP